jgi:hypothetical protein
MAVHDSRPILGHPWRWLSKPAIGTLYALGGLFLCLLLTQCASATGASVQERASMAGGTAGSVPASDGATTASVAAALQSQGFKGLVARENLPHGSVDVVQTGVNGANVSIFAPACRHISGVPCSLIFLVTFNDERQIATDAFIAQTARKIAFARLFVVERPDGHRTPRLAYTLLYQGEPAATLIVGALNLMGNDVDHYRTAYRAASTLTAK